MIEGRRRKDEGGKKEARGDQSKESDGGAQEAKAHIAAFPSSSLSVNLLPGIIFLLAFPLLSSVFLPLLPLTSSTSSSFCDCSSAALDLREEGLGWCCEGADAFLSREAG